MKPNQMEAMAGANFDAGVRNGWRQAMAYVRSILPTAVENLLSQVDEPAGIYTAGSTPSATDDRPDALFVAPKSDLEFLISTVAWMSGSSDFGPDGKAGAEWARRRVRVWDIIHKQESSDSAEDGLRDAAQACLDHWDAGESCLTAEFALLADRLRDALGSTDADEEYAEGQCLDKNPHLPHVAGPPIRMRCPGVSLAAPDVGHTPKRDECGWVGCLNESVYSVAVAMGSGPKRQVGEVLMCTDHYPPCHSATDDGWMCVCGEWNRDDELTCSRCGKAHHREPDNRCDAWRGNMPCFRENGHPGAHRGEAVWWGPPGSDDADVSDALDGGGRS